MSVVGMHEHNNLPNYQSASAVPKVSGFVCSVSSLN